MYKRQAHIPLIHTIEGKKLSKRDQASTLDDYSKIGIMPDALRNYLLRLGWSYKDKEIFTKEESIKYFNLDGIGKSPSKLDMSRILSMNEHYIKNMNENDLYDQLSKYCENYKDKILNEKSEKINIPVFEKNFSLVDVYSAQESFITGTLGSLTQVLNIDGRNIGSSIDGWPITEKLRSSYKELINA